MSEAARAQPARPSFAFARKNGATVLGFADGVAEIAHRPDVRPEVLTELRRYCGCKIRLCRYEVAEFDRLLRDLYEGGGDARQMVADMDGRVDLNALAEELPEPEDLAESDDDALIIRLLNALLSEAIRENASDIHIEPFESRLVVRFRVDGVLREVLTPQKAAAAPIVSRIKVMAKLDIAEKRLPQDGRIALRIAGRPVDVRVSTIPSGYGERVVLRLLDKQAGRLDLARLGMEADMQAAIDAMIHRPHGILLVTGPTGSGKTTTLYAALTRLNDTTRNILTVEDPIEYYLDGIGQTQVNTRVDMTFARGLRAILRQDPDVVMVGEIRDLETAEIAVQASLTGHLVLSTLHTNSAVGAVTRLRDMGVEPFLLASSLIGVLAQRLVRVLDPELREAYAASDVELAAFGQSTKAKTRPTLYRPRPGLSGKFAGYKGRSGVYELVSVDEPMRRLIHDHASEAEMEKLARSRSPSIAQDGWLKALSGLTSIEEILRVVREQ
ncbi:MAG: type II secretion system protein GspE [Lysobacterales bacterium CG02_land_8_20_14_3_00_62_12]|nr:MAG: type II secretion system protein GspE [Xanthomonadales bacterium CG02_land_8_20_14_3_00_62_12]